MPRTRHQLSARVQPTAHIPHLLPPVARHRRTPAITYSGSRLPLIGAVASMDATDTASAVCSRISEGDCDGFEFFTDAAAASLIPEAVGGSPCRNYIRSDGEEVVGDSGLDARMSSTNHIPGGRMASASVSTEVLGDANESSSQAMSSTGAYKEGSSPESAGNDAAVSAIAGPGWNRREGWY